MIFFRKELSWRILLPVQTGKSNNIHQTWNIGMVEEWVIHEDKNLTKLFLSLETHYSIIPLFHYSSGKDVILFSTNGSIR